MSQAYTNYLQSFYYPMIEDMSNFNQWTCQFSIKGFLRTSGQYKDQETILGAKQHSSNIFPFFRGFNFKTTLNLVSYKQMYCLICLIYFVFHCSTLLIFFLNY